MKICISFSICQADGKPMEITFRECIDSVYFLRDINPALRLKIEQWFCQIILRNQICRIRGQERRNAANDLGSQHENNKNVAPCTLGYLISFVWVIFKLNYTGTNILYRIGPIYVGTPRHIFNCTTGLIELSKTSDADLKKCALGTLWILEGGLMRVHNVSKEDSNPGKLWYNYNIVSTI